MSLIKKIEFPLLGDERGGLVVLESHKSIPFEIKRVYYIINTKQGVARGFHAHKQLKQVAVCVHGNCCMVLDNGLTREEIQLDSSTSGVMIEKMVWHEMHDFSEDCVLLVLANEYYDESDYIRNYNEFLRVVDGKL